MKRFHITYEVHDTDRDRGFRGFLPRSTYAPRRDNLPNRPAKFTLRQVVDLFVPRGSGPCEANSYPCRTPRWISCQMSADWEPVHVVFSVHLDSISPASARRVARLLGVR